MTEQYKGFDIETDGLHASACQVVSWSIGDVCKIQGYNVDENELIQNIREIIRGCCPNRDLIPEIL
ncbi:MAG: hypothetical protein ACT6FG_00455 [Methanosarcinaceae archaeon]